MVVVLSACGSHQEGPPPGNEPSGMSVAELSVDRLVDSGAVAAVAEVVDSNGTWRGAAGDRQVVPERPATADASFRAGSVTKEVVAVLALQLVQQGTWTLDTTIGDVLPGLWPERGGVTLEQLLGHTSGMPDVINEARSDPGSTKHFVRRVSRPWTDEGLVAAARQMPWRFAPGSRVSYSSTPFVVVGLMLERVTGQPLEALVQDRVLGPADMSHTSYPQGPGLPRGALHEYAVRDGVRVDLGSFDPSLFSAAGALVSTTDDLDRLNRALADGELLAPRLVHRMRRVGDPGEPVALGLGTMRRPDPCEKGAWLYGHDGGTFGTLTRSYTSADGDRQVTVAVTGWDHDDRSDLEAALSYFLEAAFTRAC